MNQNNDLNMKVCVADDVKQWTQILGDLVQGLGLKVSLEDQFQRFY